MIPITDHNRPLRRPIVTQLLIAINVAVFLVQVMAQRRGISLVERFGVTPDVLIYRVLAVGGIDGGAMAALITPFTSMFLHGSVLHLAGNMWFLHVFGDNVEDTLGRPRYILLYILSGLLAVIAQVFVDPSSHVPMIGASGAISGLLAGYVWLHPHARVLTLVPIFIFLRFVELPAYLFIFVWLGIQALSAWLSVDALGDSAGGVAWFAHIGGFVAGIVATRLLSGARRRPRRQIAKRTRF